MKALKFKDIVAMGNAIEGKRSQIKRGDMMELLSVLSVTMVLDSRVTETLLINGRKRLARMGRKSKK